MSPSDIPTPDRNPKCPGCNKEVHPNEDTGYTYKKGTWHYCCMRSDQVSTARTREYGKQMAESEAIRIKEFANMAPKLFKDSGKREEFSTGAVRDIRKGKGRFDLIPPIPSRLLAQHFETGCLKYGERNFEKGIPVGRYLDSCMRHLNEYREGLRDEPHLVSALWNLWNAIDTIEKIKQGKLPKELDDYHYTE
jgi:Domain of unknown function (DUF5664)